MGPELADDVMALYHEFDTQIAAMQRRFHLYCPPGCGTCCQSEKVEATILEMLPLARHFIQTGEDEQVMRQLAGLTQKRCMFYTPHTLQFGYGRCRVYPFRPTICRLFGFAAVKDKNGSLVFSSCRFVKEIAKEAVESVQSAVNTGATIPLFTDAAQRVTNLDINLGRTLLPINDALAGALSKLGLVHHLARSAVNVSTSLLEKVYPPKGHKTNVLPSMIKTPS